MPIPIWAGRYIGLPFRELGRDRAGVDCWGLVRLILAEQFTIPLPSFIHEYRHTLEKSRIGPLIERETRSWQKIATNAEAPGDVVVLRLHGKPMHVGLVLGDRHMLHIEAGINSAIERYNSPQWAERIFGFFRYREDIDEQNPFFDSERF